jgi:Pyruvate/2-oxoacid:ferredoxin oxidoreductase delta subunit
MKYHIYYFSSTGNTARAVELITQRLTSEGHDVNTMRLNRDTKPLEEEPDRILIAFPTLSWVPPILVQRFVRQLPSGLREDGTKIKAAVFTADGGGCLQSPDHLKRMLTRKHYDVFLTGRASFPDNWLQFVPGPNDEQKKQSIATGEKMTLEFTDQLITETPSYYKVALIHQVWSRLVGILFAFFGRQFMGKMFIADSSCTSCKLCQKSCPVGAIIMGNKKKSKPFWKTTCESCNRCINICPEKAIVSSNLRIVFFFAGIIASIIAALHLYNKWAHPWISGNIPAPFHWFVNTIIVTIIIFAAHWFVIGPVDRFLLRFVQRIPGLRTIFEKGFNKKFLRYTMPGYKAPNEGLHPF